MASQLRQGREKCVSMHIYIYIYTYNTHRYIYIYPAGKRGLLGKRSFHPRSRLR